MTDRQIIINIENVVCVVTPITAKEYYHVDQQSLPIFENYRHYMLLHRQLQDKAPHFDHPRVYAALKTLFGESMTLYDDYKCSFGYPFLLKITRKVKESEYALNFTDIKGGISFKFSKILRTSEELETHKERYILHKPLEEEFSKDEMAYVMTWFMFYLVGFMESFEERYDEEFARSLDYCWVIYGFHDHTFFLEQYENFDDYDEAKSRLLKSGNIPLNQVKTHL